MQLQVGSLYITSNIRNLLLVVLVYILQVGVQHSGMELLLGVLDWGYEVLGFKTP